MPIPEELWSEAVSLAREFGLKTIAQGLPLDYGALKRHLAASSEEAPAFIEIAPAQAHAAAEPLPAVVEITRPDGARMVMRLPGLAPVDIAGLAASFCGGR
jgi:hypothetical protein